MAALEESLQVHADDLAFASLYLRLGRLKRAYERWLARGAPTEAYAQAHPYEYKYNEVGADYLYTGYHFRELLNRFPQSEVADSAAWELTRLSPGGECEGYVPCYIERQFAPVADFLSQYPNSPFAVEGVRRANEAFTRALSDVADLTEPSDCYRPAEVQALLSRYDSVAERLPAPVRVSATLTIADVWARFQRRERARPLYEWVLATGGASVDTAAVRRRLRALAAPTLALQPAGIVSDTRVELRWDAPPGVAVDRYVVLRSAASDSDGQSIGEIAGAATRAYSDRTARPGTEYWYRVRARTAGEEVASNAVHATTPSAILSARALVFNSAERRLYVFGYLENGFPRVLAVSERGEVVAGRDGALYGVEQYAPRDHRFDSYVDEAWFVDGAGQAFLRFRKADNGFGADLRTAIRSDVKLVATDTAGMPYYGLLVSVNPGAHEMWIAPRGRAYALSWDYAHSVSWEGREGDVRLVDAAGKAIKEIRMPRPSSGENEFVMAIRGDPRDRSAWAYLSRKGTLVHIDSSGGTGSSLTLEPLVGADLPIAFDLAHGAVWVVLGPWNGRRLIKLGLPSGKTLATISGSLEDLPITIHLAADTSSGGLWVLAGSRLTKMDQSGARVLQATLPTR